MLFCVLASLILVTVNDLMSLFLVLELQSFALYILVAINRNSHISTETGLKYFIYGSFASCTLLYGITLIFGSMGTLNFFDIFDFMFSATQTPFVLDGIFLGFILILGGLFFKIGVFPFHVWLPDIYEGASLIITFFLAILPKIPVVFILFRVFGFAFDFTHIISNFSVVISFITICCAFFSILLVL